VKILIAGLGSIGKRHLRAIQGIGGIETAALRTGKGTLKDKSDIQEFYSVEEALEYKPDGVLIANPTSKHVETALPFLEKGIKVLIEKPIDDSISQSKKLEPYKENILVAYCMRFHPLSLFMKELSTRENIFKISFQRSFYLPKMHPYADYRTEYAAKKELGGGVIRTFSHEIDMMLHWFGESVNVTGITDKISHLEMDTDDFAYFTAKTKNGARINFELDFFAPVNINVGEAFTEKGKYFWDTKGIQFIGYDESELIDILKYPENVFDIMYLEQIKDFIGFINGNPSTNATYNSAIQVLEIIENIDAK
jgi:predicted dehydrogenase